MNRSLLSATITAVIAASTGVNAFAAVLEEVIVTATKRGEFNVQSLGEAIYAVDSESMKAKNQVNFEDIAGSVPGLQFQDLGPGDKEFIIRGINLLGINSAMTPMDIRNSIWDRLASQWKPTHLDTIIRNEINLDGLPDAFVRMLESKSVGRTVVRIHPAEA